MRVYEILLVAVAQFEDMVALTGQVLKLDIVYQEDNDGGL